MMLARVCRWGAVALAIVAIVDPAMPWPRRERPSLRVLDGPASAGLGDRLREKGFTIGGDGESAVVVPVDAGITPTLPSPPVFVLSERASSPDVTIVRASAPAARVAEQAVAVSVTLRARAARGMATTVRLEDAGLAVATAAHTWGAEDETWQTTLSYLPEGSSALRLRVRADVLAGERRTADNIADVLAPAMRGPVRTLVIESGVTWPAVFVRRALEAAPGFAVSSLQRATNTVSTRAGSPPRGKTRTELAPYEVVVIGQSDALTGPDADALRWFVEDRGGVAVFVPDHIAADKPLDLAGGITFETKTLDAPAALAGFGAGLMASELAVARALPSFAFPLAADAAGVPIVFGVRRGAGAVIVSGALDAWRYRDRNDAAFTRFWPAAILQQALTAPPLVEVTAGPSLARPGDVVRVSARLRQTEIASDASTIAIPSASARVLHASGKGEDVVRLWPTAEPGMYEGEWRPAATGDYVVDASIGAMSGATIVNVGADVVRPSRDVERLAITARATGGTVVEGEGALVRSLTDRFAAHTVTRPLHPERSVWYAVAFALLLCGEWALRRRGGLV